LDDTAPDPVDKDAAGALLVFHRSEASTGFDFNEVQAYAVGEMELHSKISFEKAPNQC
jgi:hypothetical protein